MPEPYDGLSPRERGNPQGRKAVIPIEGSIPARAGEPTSRPNKLFTGTVYPRASGGTCERRSQRNTHRGLSPRERGNQLYPAAALATLRSIPARAGEPGEGTIGLMKVRVYPRASGGTDIFGREPHDYEGLSPRERGNLRSLLVCSSRGLSIPARAGEPLLIIGLILLSGVYPRASGGTEVTLGPSINGQGLSPRERGNRPRLGCRTLCSRSIPARAGEPLVCDPERDALRVYPRASGGTHRAVRPEQRVHGLSPRERGNPSTATVGHAPQRGDCDANVHKDVAPRAPV